MATQPPRVPTQPVAGANAAWTLYRQCAATSAFHKSRLESLTRISLWLGLLGAVIATVSSVLPLPPGQILSKALGMVGSLVVALAGVAAAQALAGNRDRLWVECRGIGEALKSSVYMFCASAPPFDGANRSVMLSNRVEEALKNISGIELRSADGRSAPGPLTVDDYIKLRVDDQVAWYTQKAAAFQKKADFWRICSFAGAAAGAIMGVVSSLYSLSPWVALLATATASVTAYVRNQRYSSMIGLYQVTAIRLRALKDQWMDSEKSEADKAERDSFIQSCEQTMSIENGAWIAQWSQQPNSEKSVPAAPPLLPATTLENLKNLRDLSKWDELIRLADERPLDVQQNAEIRQILALALNRRNVGNDRDRAVALMEDLIAANGGDGETYGILGLIYKDRFEVSKDPADASKAISSYRAGFQKEPSDLYHCVNLTTLLLMYGGESGKRELEKLLPGVRQALLRIDPKSSDYWEVATALQLASVAGEWEEADKFAAAIIQRTATSDLWKLQATLLEMKRLEQAMSGSSLERIKKTMASLEAVLKPELRRSA